MVTFGVSMKKVNWDPLPPDANKSLMIDRLNTLSAWYVNNIIKPEVKKKTKVVKIPARKQDRKVPNYILICRGSIMVSKLLEHEYVECFKKVDDMHCVFLSDKGNEVYRSRHQKDVKSQLAMMGLVVITYHQYLTSLDFTVGITEFDYFRSIEYWDLISQANSAEEFEDFKLKK